MKILLMRRLNAIVSPCASPYPSVPLLRFKCALVPQGEREEFAPSRLVGEGWGEGKPQHIVRLIHRATFALTCACLASSTLTFAAGQTSANFAIPRDTINAGVANMTSASFSLASSVGDAVAGGAIASVSFRLSSGFQATVNVSPAVLNLLSVVSRKIHGATPFSLTIAHTEPLNGNITVEPRVIGAGHTLVFHFDNTVTSVTAAATALDTLMNSVGNATASVANGDIVVALNNVADNKRLTVTIAGINGAGTAHASMGFLVGDVNNTRAVNPGDVSGVKAQAGQVATALNFQFDVNVSGAINAADIATVKARSGVVLVQ